MRSGSQAMEQVPTFPALGFANKVRNQAKTANGLVAYGTPDFNPAGVTASLDDDVFNAECVSVVLDGVAPAAHPMPMLRPVAPAATAKPNTQVASGQIKGFDALRAFAIAGVVAYHLAPQSLPGGYLGVDIFFVLSGFLITRGLCSTWAKRHDVSLTDFFARRFNRIVPSLVVVLLVCTTFALAVGGDVLVNVDKQLFGAVTFSSNWLTIFAGGDYFAATTPALFANLWFLALDVQFYLLWPPLLVLLLKTARGSRIWAWAAGIGVASAGLMLGLSFTDASLTRLYEGTDTHFFALMFGSALALGFAYNGGALAKLQNQLTVRGAGQLGWLAACTLVVLFFTLQWTSLASFRGLMVLAALLSVLVLYLLVSYPALGAVLEVKPLQWLGKHSYGIFLWHWPMLVILAAAFGQRYDAPSWWLIITVLAAAVALTLATEKLVNAPMHALGTAGYFRRIWELPRTARLGISAVATAALVATTAAVAIAPAESLITRQILAGAEQAALTRQAEMAAAEYAARKVSAEYQANLALASGSDTMPLAQTAQKPEPKIIAPTGDHITAIGDSVLLAATPALAEKLPGMWIDGAVSRQFFHAAPIVHELKETGDLRHYIIVALATNGTVTEGWVDQLMDAIGPDHVVLFVNGYGNRAWIPEAAAELANAAARFPGKVYVADWNAVAARDSSLLGGDGIHPSPAGMEAYANLVVDTLNAIAGVAKPVPVDLTAQDLFAQ